MDLLYDESNIKAASKNKPVEELTIYDVVPVRNEMLHYCNFVGIKKGNQIKVIKDKGKAGRVISLKTK